MIVHLDEIESGLCYRSKFTDYLCLYKTQTVAIMLCYEQNHYVATVEFWDDMHILDIPDLEYVPDSDYPLTEFVDKLQLKDSQTLKYTD